MMPPPMIKTDSVVIRSSDLVQLNKEIKTMEQRGYMANDIAVSGDVMIVLMRRFEMPDMPRMSKRPKK